MRHILISGLVNLETTARVQKFPIDYYPIDYPFFGVSTAVSGVGLNLALALHTLGDRVTLLSMTGEDMAAQCIRQTLRAAGIDTACLLPCLRETPNSVVLYDGTGRRQIYCDLKDIQEASCEFRSVPLEQADLVAACNTNFNRPLLPLAKSLGKPIATDVHVLTDLHDGYNRDFLRYADIVFLSDEGIGADYRGFLEALVRTYGTQIAVLGRGSRGAAMYLRETGQIYELPAAHVGPVVNTVGAGDALFSSFLHFYAHGLSPLEALSKAQLFAAAKIRVSGAAKGFVTEAELEALQKGVTS